MKKTVSKIYITIFLEQHHKNRYIYELSLFLDCEVGHSLNGRPFLHLDQIL